MPRVSVILPAFNAADTIAATLESVMAQSFGDWEVLVVDDGSTDDTIASASRVAAGDTRIRLISQQNQGVSAARNHGIDLAGGELLLFLDADDTIAPEHLALLTKALDARDAEVAYCGYQRIGSTGSALAPVFEEAIAAAPFEGFAHANKVAIHSVLVPRALVSAVGGFDPGLVTCEDWDLWLRIARTGARFVGVATPLAFYRMQPRSLSRDFSRLTADALVVLARARTSDDRVAAAAAHHDGSTYDVAIAAGHFVIWAATAAATAGQPVAPLVAMLPPADFAGAETDVVATVRDALAIGGESSDALGRRWEGAAPALAPLLAAIERHASRAGVARRIVYVLERDMVRDDPLDQPLFLTTVCGVRYDIAALEAIDPGSADLLHLRIDSAGSPLFTHELPLLGSLSARDVARHVLATCGTDDLASRVHWPRFSINTTRTIARSLPRTILRMARRRSTRAGWCSLMLEAWAADHSNNAQSPRASVVHADVVRAATLRAEQIEAAPPPPDIHRTIRWGGIEARAEELCRTQATRAVPVLMYHSVAAGDAGALARWRVAPEQFEEQLRLLRRHGCYALSVEALGWYHARGEAVPGRPVVITFDDGFRDLAETAWPILYRNAMAADVFVVTNRVGAQSDWDRRLGEPQPLLDWNGLATLRAQGLGVHSHLASHRHVDSLTTRELLDEAVASRETIARRLGGEVRALAPPYGGSDERAVRLFDAAGYHLCFTTENGMASLDDHSLRLPRIEVYGDMTIAQFAEAVGLA